ncbi:MAG TPA: DUF177 domain-containing protein [Blastocatellia bacterium]|nr:DUF177 domain-containing protein [Blastocatellia bacterium]
MKIDVSHLDDRKEVRHKYADFDLEDETLKIREQPELKLDLQRQSDGVHASGNVKAGVDVECDRCLAPVPVNVDSDFDLVYLPLSAAPSTAGEHEIVEDRDFDLAYFEDDAGQVIDVDALVREQISLGMPVHSLCNPECKGLCPTCGIDLNTGSCNCKSEAHDPRWDALAKLKQQ